MNCRDFVDSLPELAGEMGGEAQAHLGECARCRLYLEHQRQLSEGLRNVGREMRRVKAPGRIESALLAEFRGQTGWVEAPRARRWWSPAVAWGTAAAVLAAAALLFVVRVRQAETPAVPYPAESASVDWTATLPEGTASTAAAGEFIPLPNADRLPPDEHVNMVRVELPRSAMIALGYAVSADRADEMVEADVVLGSDGLARAVRLVNENEAEDDQ